MPTNADFSMEPTLTDDEERFMLWLEQEDDVTGHHAGNRADVPPHWEGMRREVKTLGDLLRAHLPESVEPPSPAAFNSQVQQRLG